MTGVLPFCRMEASDLRSGLAITTQPSLARGGRL
jgi:hypothetical protein